MFDDEWAADCERRICCAAAALEEIFSAHED